MPVLSCPACAAAIDVAISSAGSEVVCPQCQSTVAVPKLGELRKLAERSSPAASDQAASTTQTLDRDDAAAPWRVGFTALAAVTAVAIVLAGYCLMRWAAIEVPATTEAHIASVEQGYLHSPPAELIHDWQELEVYRPEFAGPYQYQAIANTRADWLHKGITAAVIAALAAAAALFCGARARPSSPQP